MTTGASAATPRIGVAPLRPTTSAAGKRGGYFGGLDVLMRRVAIFGLGVGAAVAGLPGATSMQVPAT